MDIITDSHYLIGKSHLTCDDYAVNGPNYIFISDGCSGSPRSDIGARLYSLAFEAIVKSPLLFDYDRFGDSLSYDVVLMRSFILANSECIDATAVGAYIDDGNKVNLFMYGDGIIFYKLKDDAYPEFVSVSFEKEIPYYLSYLKDNERNEIYKNHAAEWEGNCKKISGSILTQTPPYVSIETLRLPYNHPVAMEFNVSELEYVGVSSDGLDQFVKTESNGSTRRLPLYEVLNQLLTFDSINKSFVKRRLKRVRDIYAKDSTHNLDDISLAIMYFKD